MLTMFRWLCTLYFVNDNKMNLNLNLNSIVSDITGGNLGNYHVSGIFLLNM